MYTRQNLALSFVLAISMVGISYGVGGDMGAATEPLTDGSAAYPYLIEDLADFDEFADQTCRNLLGKRCLYEAFLRP